MNDVSASVDELQRAIDALDYNSEPTWLDEVEPIRVALKLDMLEWELAH